MEISYYTVKDNLDTTRGYGAAGFKVVTSLQELGHSVPFDEPTAPVQISFCAPQWYKFRPGQYKIGYTPWESTELPAGWVEKMNECDEVWATSQWVADVYRNCGVTVPVFVYEHGLDPEWQPIKRKKSDVVKFLHIGEPALRKGGQMAIDAFRAVFGEREDVHLTVKAYHSHYLRVWQDGKLCFPEKADLKNISIVTRLFSPEELHELYASHDIFVYPSYGEGFGFLPLQALGTGMPTISTYEWASYEKFLGPLAINGRWDRSIWSVHPGNVLYPDYNDLKDAMLCAYENLDYLREVYYAQASQIHAEYNWKVTTDEMFKSLEKRLTGT